MASSKPAFVFVGGVSHPPAIWHLAIKALNDLGYSASAVQFPTCADDPAKIQNTKQWDEVDATKAAVSKYLDEENKDAVLVLHSYGGWPGSRAVKGLDKEARQAAGKGTGIIELVMLAAFILPDNAVKKDFSYLPPWLDVKDDCRRVNESAIPLLFNDIPEADAKYWLSKMEWQKNDLTEGTMPDAPWALSIPKTFIITTADQVASPAFQMDFLKGVIDKTWAVKTIESGHSPFLSQPQNLVKVLLQPTVRL